MRKDILVLLFLAACGVLVFYKSFFNFFAQDDFILINHFSQNGFFANLANVFGKPIVTHWRPIHSLYFFIGGSLFGKNYVAYHLLALIIHITSSFLIYKTMIKITKNAAAAIGSAIFYITSPVHFVSLYWISGGATLVGFTFLIASFYFYLLKKFALTIGLFIAALLASEAMVMGAGIFLAWSFWENGKLKIGKPMIWIGAIAVFFAFIQFIFLSPSAAVDAYRIKISPGVLIALKYYLLRIPGFIEGTGLTKLSAVFILWLFTIGVLGLREFLKRTAKRIFIFAALVILFGFFPFVLIPNHLSPHYMNISLWGASILVGLSLVKIKRPIVVVLLAAIVVINFLAVGEIGNSHWVIQRGNLAKNYLGKIQSDNVPSGTRLIFGNNKVSTSLDAYYALGTGEAIKFWFKGKNYRTCFSAFENCGSLP